MNKAAGQPIACARCDQINLGVGVHCSRQSLYTAPLQCFFVPGVDAGGQTYSGVAVSGQAIYRWVDLDHPARCGLDAIGSYPAAARELFESSVMSTAPLVVPLAPGQHVKAWQAIAAGRGKRAELIGHGVAMSDLADVAERVVDIDDHRWLTRHVFPPLSSAISTEAAWQDAVDRRRRADE